MFHIKDQEWGELLNPFFATPELAKLYSTVSNAYLDADCYPHPLDIFRALETTTYSKTKVVILGQDPYHTKGIANGMAFATNPDNATPPSLRNIFAEVYRSTRKQPQDRTLLSWAGQGVLLLNTTLTVQEGTPEAHTGFGWQEFTSAVIDCLLEKKTALVYLLFGAHAQGWLRDRTVPANQLVIPTSHPSPRSFNKGSTASPAFWGSDCFLKANSFLAAHGETPITWAC